MKLPRKMLRLKMLRYCFLFVMMILFGLAGGFLIKFCIFWYHWPYANDLFEDNKCPACYGVELCPAIFSGEIPTGDKGMTEMIYYYVNSQNVYVLNDKYILKKLASQHELRKFDAEICRILKQRSGANCEFEGLTKYDNLTQEINEMATTITRNGFFYGMTMCSDSDGLDEILQPYLDQTDPERKKISLVNIWTIMNVNPEPIMLKFFNADADNWPVPKYYGACGRAILEEKATYTLSDLLKNDWLDRAVTALRLLEMADSFTFKHDRFRFYLTDVAIGNIGFRGDDRFPLFIDLEHIIIVDKIRKDPSAHWTLNHTSEVIPCEECFAFSTVDICDHQLSDHNHYAVCDLIYSQVLVNPPHYIKQVSPNFSKVLYECFSPEKTGDRFKAAKILYDEIKKILRAFKKTEIVESISTEFVAPLKFHSHVLKYFV